MASTESSDAFFSYIYQPVYCGAEDDIGYQLENEVESYKEQYDIGGHRYSFCSGKILYCIYEKYEAAEYEYPGVYDRTKQWRLL